MKIEVISKIPTPVFAFLALIIFATAATDAQPPLNVWQSNGPNANIHTVVVDPFNPNVIYAGSHSGIFKSVNNGASWFLLSQGTMYLAVDHVNPNTIYAIMLGVLSKSTNGGVNWSSLNAPGLVYRFGVSQSNPNHIVAVTATNPLNVFVTTNGGGTWETRPFSFPKPDIYPSVVDFDPQNPNIIYMYAFNYQDFIGCFKTTNGGASWGGFDYGSGVYSTSIFKVNSSNSNIVYAGTWGGVFKTTDGGGSWAWRGRPQIDPATQVDAIAVDPLNPSVLYAGVIGDGVFKTVNDGVPWTEFNNGLTNLYVHDLAFAPTNRFLHAATSTGVFSVKVEAWVVNRRADFDGDGKTDISVFRPSNGQWWYLQSSNGQSAAAQFSASTDLPVPGDYTGDGKADIAHFRPETGEWFILRSENGSYYSYQFGLPGDIPAPADYDGDGITDTATFRPSTATWYIFNSGTSSYSILTFGLDGDHPVPADYEGDGKADIAVWRPSNGSWWIVRSSDLQQRGYGFGLGTDKPVPGDYTGDGKADIAVWRPTTGEWFFLRSEDGSYYSYPFGSPGDIPAPGDYDGDGRFDAAVFRPSDTNWYVQRSSAGIMIRQFGLAGDTPVPAAFQP